MTTAIDDLAAKITGLRLSKKYNSDVLYLAHIRNPKVKALEYGFVSAYVNELVRPVYVKRSLIDAAVKEAAV